MSTDGMHLLDASGRAIVSWVSHALPTASVLLLAAIAVDALVARHVRASLRIALYAPVALRVLAMATWTMPLHTAAGVTSLLTPVPDTFLQPVVADAGPQPVAWWAVAALVVHVAVATVLAARIVGARLSLARLTRSARPYGVDAHTGTGTGTGTGTAMRIAVHESVGPLVEGIVTPRIVLPARLLASDLAAALSCVLAHEEAHVRRRDPWLLAGVQLLTVVAWPFIPVWIAAWRVRRLIEVACDEAAVADSSDDERRRYGHTLLDIASDDAHAAAALGIGARTLRARIVALASSRRWPRSLQVLAVSACVVVLAACGTARPTETAEPTSGSAQQGASGAAAPRVALRDLYPCARAGLANTDDDGMSGWALVEPPPAAADPALSARCRSAPYVEAMQKNNWAAEARNALGQIGKDMSTAYAEHQKKGAPHLCPSSGPTPPAVPFADAPVQAGALWKTDPSWSCMNFEFSIPVMFQYRIESTDHAFSATAVGHRKEADGRVTELTVVMRGKVDGAGDLWLASSFEETWRTL